MQCLNADAAIAAEMEYSFSSSAEWIPCVFNVESKVPYVCCFPHLFAVKTKAERQVP
jgi:hypothetical protein